MNRGADDGIERAAAGAMRPLQVRLRLREAMEADMTPAELAAKRRARLAELETLMKGSGETDLPPAA